MKIIFGAGNGEEIQETYSTFNQWQMSKILNNKNLGVLPEPESTVFVLYRVGGGKVSNVAQGAINKVIYLNADFRGDRTDAENILKTLKVENTTPSISGKDMPSEKEIKYLIKYHNAAQERCVTVKDYIDRILMLIKDEPNLREVQAFPPNASGADQMMGSPSELTREQLRELGIKIEVKKDE